jgi:hypothetical protein
MGAIEKAKRADTVGSAPRRLSRVIASRPAITTTANAANEAKRPQVRETLRPRRQARAHRRGIAFLPMPGPSYIIIVMGLWMLAGELLPLTRFFDRAEVRLRGLGRWIRGLWTNPSAVVRVLKRCS